MNIQAKVALAKLRHPERFCPTHRCLWQTGGGYCPRHEDVLVPTDRLQAIYDSGSAMQEARTKTGARPAQARFRERLSKPLAGVLAHHDPPAVHEPIRLIDPTTGESQVYLSLHEGGRGVRP